MAGIDKEHLGEARPQAELKIGYLAQEPELDETKDVRGNVEDGVREIKDVIDEFNAISDRFAEPLSDDEMAELMDRQGELQLKIDAVDGWDLERKIDVPRTHCGCQPMRLTSQHCRAVSAVELRSAGCCSPIRTCFFLTNQPTIWTPKALPG